MFICLGGCLQRRFPAISLAHSRVRCSRGQSLVFRPYVVFSGTVPRVPAVHGANPSCVRGDSPWSSPCPPGRGSAISLVRAWGQSFKKPSLTMRESRQSLVRAWGQSLPTQNVPTYALTLTRYLENSLGTIRTSAGA